MVEVATKTAAPTQAAPTSSARAARLARLERINEQLEFERVLVEPASEVMRKTLRASDGGGFRARGPASWPLDSYTRQCLADGSIRRVEEEKTEAEKHGEEERPGEEEQQDRKRRR
jgi:hypothetical protein